MTLRLRTRDLEWVESEGEVMALDAEASVYLSANPAAAFLWQTLAAGTTESELVDALVARYGIDTERAATDVAAFLAQLENRGLLERP